MSLIEIITLALALSMDAFAVALCKGACLAELKDKGESAVIAVSFGFFQALMTLTGWFLGSRFQGFIESVDHFIAFGLLGFIGGKLIFEAWKNTGKELVCTPLRFPELMMLSIATSIDALAVGLSLAMIQVSIWYPCVIIGLVTAAMSVIGIRAGRYFGEKLGHRMAVAGGVILILIGLKILVSHLAA